MSQNVILKQVTVKSAGEVSRLAWTQGRRFRVPEAAFAFFREHRLCGKDGVLTLNPDAPRLPVEIANTLRFRNAFIRTKPMSSRFPVSYQRIPPQLRTLIARGLGRGRRSRLLHPDAFPAWPLDLSADFLTDLAEEKTASWEWFPTPVLVSHDIDSEEGLTNLLRYFVPLAEQYQAFTTNYVVPCKWPLDHGVMTEVHQRGHEIGVHGYDHSNVTPFARPSVMEKRVLAGVEMGHRYGACGYRAPSLVRTRPLLRALAPHFKYDSSMPTSGGLFPVPDNGCASARPFWTEGILEIPLSLPRDGGMIFYGCSPDEMLETWISCAEQISQSGGIVVLLTHCEKHFSGNPPMLAAYEKFLAYIAEHRRQYYFTTGAQLAECILKPDPTHSREKIAKRRVPESNVHRAAGAL